MKPIHTLVVMGFVVPHLLWADRFTLNGEMVYDTKTELTWQRHPSTQKYGWSDAKKHCTDLNDEGQSDWRLPNIYELKSLVDYTKYNPAIATSLIKIQTDDWYWSSSEDVDDSSSAWDVYFDLGNDCWALSHLPVTPYVCGRGQ